MGRPSKPTAVLELVGAYQKNPQRKRQKEPKPSQGIGSFSLGPTSIPEIWDEIVGQVVPGVLTISDRMALELVCRLYAEIRLNPDEISVGKVTALANLLGRFGLTPSDRAKISMPEEEKEDEWSGF
jgi:hypothetical protein